MPGGVEGGLIIPLSDSWVIHISFAGREHVEGLGRIKLLKIVHKLSRIQAVDIIEVKMSGDQKAGTGMFGQEDGLPAGKAADDILYLGAVIISSVYGEDHDMAAFHPLFETGVRAAVTGVIEQGISKLEYKANFFVISICILV